MDIITFPLIVICVIVFIAGAFLGVLLGRRSKTANAYVDSIQREADEWKQKAKEAEAKLRSHLKG